jgi:hypothetical protein
MLQPVHCKHGPVLPPLAPEFRIALNSLRRQIR